MIYALCLSKETLYPKMGEFQFWTANIGLAGMLFFYSLNIYSNSEAYSLLSVGFGAVEAFSIFLFFYNMLATLLTERPK